MQSQTCKTITIGSTEIMLSHPAKLPLKWVGQKDLIKQVLAAWMVIDERDVPFNPRLIGKPGVGKTTLGYAAARQLNREVYLFQATMDTRPEDLIVITHTTYQNRIYVFLEHFEYYPYPDSYLRL